MSPTRVSSTLFLVRPNSKSTVPRQVDYADTHRAADPASPRLARELVAALSSIATAASINLIEEALARGVDADTINIIAGFDAGSKKYLAPLFRRALARVNANSADMALDRLATMFDLDRTSLGSIAVDSAAWARFHTGQLITDIGLKQKTAITDIITDGLSSNIPVPELARRIKSVIGLTSRQFDQLAKFRSKLESDGLPLNKIEFRAAKFRQALLRQRSITIARTETINAANGGQELSWKRAVRQRLIVPEEARKVWIVTPDDVLDPLICEPMPDMPQNQHVPIGGYFMTPQGKRIQHPTAHPLCRCTTGLVIEKQA